MSGATIVTLGATPHLDPMARPQPARLLALALLLPWSVASRTLMALAFVLALQALPVMFAIDRAGLVGADGATHAGAYDIPFLRCIPNMSVACPADERECRQLLSTAYAQNHPVTVRYPRGAGTGVQPNADLQALPFGQGEIRRGYKGKVQLLLRSCTTCEQFPG